MYNSRLFFISTNLTFNELSFPSYRLLIKSEFHVKSTYNLTLFIILTVCHPFGALRHLRSSFYNCASPSGLKKHSIPKYTYTC